MGLSPSEIIAIVSAFANILVLGVSAWIKADIANLKLYMHEKFITRTEYHRRFYQSSTNRNTN
jgi:hypothetical protein